MVLFAFVYTCLAVQAHVVAHVRGTTLATTEERRTEAVPKLPAEVIQYIKDLEEENRHVKHILVSQPPI